MSKKFSGLLAILLACLGLSGQAENTDVYLFTSFRGNGDGLHLASSQDGRKWTDLNRVFLKPDVGSKLFRDPQILLGPDGLYHMVWTSGWNDKGIGYASSKDLLNWSGQKYIPLIEKMAGAERCWAPELFYDEDTKNYILYWSSSAPMAGLQGDQFRAYYTLTKDFQSFTEPKMLFDPDFNNIDTTMLRVGKKYMIVMKEGDDQRAGKWGPVHAAEADHPLGPYKLLPDPIISNERVEGPALENIGGKTLIYVDYYVNQRYGVRETSDWKMWTDVTQTTSVVPGQRHGSIFSVPANILAGLLGQEKQSTAIPPKPILDGFTADPSIRAFGDTYYIYPTSDRPNWNTTEFAVWSSKNLVEWKKEGVFMDLTKDLTWATNKAWAPDCVERDGKYYFYFCANHNIGVAVGDSPVGPFKDALGHPLITNGTLKTFTIDPCAFIDDDGQAYLYFGNGTPTVYKLNRDMISFDGPPVQIKLREFREGIVVFKRNGKYYFMWSIDDARSPNYRVGWGIADSPFGPVKSPEKDFIVLQKNGPAVATAHHGVVNVPGTDRWYVAYHRHAIPDGSGYKREVCLARMEFNPDGSIKPMDPMVTPFQPGDVGEPIVNGKGLAVDRDFHMWADTPPMGWNSWDCFGTTVTEAQTKQQADFMADKLKPHGWQYVVVDIQWYEPGATGHDYRKDAKLAMDEFSRLVPAPEKFPSAANGQGFKPLADYVHTKGLKFGIHMMRGISRQAVRLNTPIKGTSFRAADIADTNSICHWNPDMFGVDMIKPGAQAYYDSIMELVASWGVDFVKIDDLSRPYDKVQKAEIEGIRKAIDKTGRAIVLSTSPGETPLAEGRHVAQHANMWRISDDFWDDWKALRSQFKRLHDWTPYRKAGAWPDADMLPLGKVRFGQPTHFTPDEQITLMTLWSIARSPLIHGGDMTRMDDFTLSLLTNDEVLAVDQNSSNNRQLFRTGDGLVVWTADVPGSTAKYLAVFNLRDVSAGEKEGNAARVPVKLADLGLSGEVLVRDLWQKKDLEKITNEFSPEVVPHGARLFRLMPIKP